VSGRIAVEYEVVQRSGSMLIDAWLGGEPGALGSALRHLLLPTIVLGTVPLAVVARMTRSAMLEVLREDYVRTARAKGLSPLRVMLVHALRNALMPVITVVGLQTGSLLGGAVLTETIFAWPGIGKWIVEAIARRDYPVVQAGILIAAAIFIGVNLCVDLLYGLVNPRVRDAR
jgi:dipeptide transport system permease protein